MQKIDFKKFINPFSVMVLSLLIAACCVSLIRSFNDSFEVMQTSFEFVEASQKEITYSDTKGNLLTLEVDADGSFSPHMWATYQFMYLDKKYLREADFENSEANFYIDDEWVKTESLFQITYDMANTNENNAPIRQVSEDWFTVIPMIIHQAEMRSSYHYFYQLILTFMISGLGVVLYLYPKELWQFKTALLVKNGEPSDFYLFTSKASGVVCVFTGTFFSVLSLLYDWF